MRPAVARINVRRRPIYLQVALVGVALLLLLTAYAGAMQLTLDYARDHSASTRDTLYAAIHLGVLAFAAVAGFALGKWLNGLGLAYATLFVVVLATAMVFGLFGSQALACRGHNDVLRHWSCQVE